MAERKETDKTHTRDMEPISKNPLLDDASNGLMAEMLRIQRETPNPIYLSDYEMCGTLIGKIHQIRAPLKGSKIPTIGSGTLMWSSLRGNFKIGTVEITNVRTQKGKDVTPTDLLYEWIDSETNLARSIERKHEATMETPLTVVTYYITSVDMSMVTMFNVLSINAVKTSMIDAAIKKGKKYVTGY
jgi:hypothetical protein